MWVSPPEPCTELISKTLVNFKLRNLLWNYHQILFSILPDYVVFTFSLLVPLHIKYEGTRLSTNCRGTLTRKDLEMLPGYHKNFVGALRIPHIVSEPFFLVL